VPQSAHRLLPGIAARSKHVQHNALGWLPAGAGAGVTGPGWSSVFFIADDPQWVADPAQDSLPRKDVGVLCIPVGR
jgi:hypothetical protein